MAFIINIALDPDLPLMVWADVSVLYPNDYVLTRKGRMVRATENKIHYLINRAISDVRKTLKASGKAEDYLDFRTRVVERLCTGYGFINVTSSTRVIIHEEVEDLVKTWTPRLKATEAADTEPAQCQFHKGNSN